MNFMIGPVTMYCIVEITLQILPLVKISNLNVIVVIFSVLFIKIYSHSCTISCSKSYCLNCKIGLKFVK